MRTASSDDRSDNQPHWPFDTSTEDDSYQRDGLSRADARRAAARAELLRRALGELEPIQRFVVECHVGLRGHPMTFREIAELMDRSLSTVHKHWRKARKRLATWGGEHSGLYEGLDLRTSANTTDGVEFESVCLSPFLPHRYGLPTREAERVAWELFGG